MRNRATFPRFSRLTLLCGGVLGLASAVALSQWASGQPASLSLAPADGGQGQAAPPRPSYSSSPTTAAPAAKPLAAPAAAPTAPPASKTRDAAYANGQPAALLADRYDAAPLPLPRPSAKSGPAAGDQLQLESYPWNNATRNVLAGWQQLARERADLRIVIDEANSQALIYASSAVHGQIRQQLAQAAPDLDASAAAGQRAAQQGAQPVAAEASTTASITLKNLPATELQPRVERLLSRHLAVRGDATGQWQTFTAETTPGAGVLIAVNGRTNEVRMSGPATQVANWRSIIEAFENQKAPDGSLTEIVATKSDQEPFVRRALGALQFSSLAARGTAAVASMLFQGQPGATPVPPPSAPGAQPVIDGQSQAVSANPSLSGLPQAAAQGLLGQVQINFLEGANIVIIRGRESDVQQVLKIIQQIEEITKTSTPEVRVYTLQHVNSVSMAALLRRVYDEVFSPRLGSLQVTALDKPNAILLVGPKTNVDMAVDKIITLLDQPVTPQTRFEVFRLKYAPASTTKTTVDSLLTQATTGPATTAPDLTVVPALAPRAIIVADTQTNSLIVSGGQQDIAHIAELLRQIDAPSGDAVDRVQVFVLKNATATALAEVLTTAFTAPATAGAAGGGAAAATRNQALEIIPLLGNGQALRSGSLSNIRITAEPTSNSLVVTAPEESMSLIKALIERLDVAPDLAAQLKVFAIRNGDAQALADMLATMFAVNQGTGAGGAAAAGGLSQGGLVRLQFSADSRTNSIIVAGAPEDLAVVAAILYQLDSTPIREHEVHVYRLKNAFATNVATAAQNWLLQQLNQESLSGLTTPFTQYQRNVVIVAEPSTNNLIISASPDVYERLKKDVIEPLDLRPPMVEIQVLIAEVRLSDTDEFGVELGLQDSVLFNRSQLSSFDTQDVTTTSPNGTQTTTQNIINAVGLPGLNFNTVTSPLGNNVGSGNPSSVGTQGLSNFGVGRTNGDLGFSGFVFSAQSSGVNVLLRALQEKRRLEILSRPHLMALDAQFGGVQVGQDVPIIQTTTPNTLTGGQTNTYQYSPVGLILTVTPLISPDGRVVMNVYAEKSEVGPEAEGIPIDISTNGTVLRIPRIDRTRAQTVVSAMDGQTVVLGGLITSRKVDTHRRVPLVADVPLIGDLFRYDSVSEERRELLIILTPRVVQPDSDTSDRIKLVESSRMSWIMSDVIAVSGVTGLRSRCDEWYEGETDSVFPSYVPQQGELCPSCAPNAMPSGDPNMQTPMLQPLPMGSPQLTPPTPPIPPTPPQGGGYYPSANRTSAPAPPVEPARYQTETLAPPPSSSAATRSTPPQRLPTVR